MVVVDSGSTDRTVADRRRIRRPSRHAPVRDPRAAMAVGARRTCRSATEWVLALDADQQLTPELRDEITARAAEARRDRRVLPQSPADFPRPLDPPRRLLPEVPAQAVSPLDGSASTRRELVDHHFQVAGRDRTAAVRHDRGQPERGDDRGLDREAQPLRDAAGPAGRPASGSRARPGDSGAPSPAPPMASTSGHARRKRIWSRLPLFVRPCLYVFYRYVMQLGFLDGKEGFHLSRPAGVLVPAARRHQHRRTALRVDRGSK